MLQTGIFVLLCAEVLFISFLSVPMPLRVRRALVRYVSASTLLSQVQLFFQFFIVMVFVLFVDALREVINVQNKKNNLEDNLTAGITAELNARLFKAQRNAYMDGFAILGILVLHRLFDLVRNLSKTTTNLEVVQKQAEAAKTAYMQLLDDKAALQTRYELALENIGEELVEDVVKTKAAREAKDKEKKAADAEAKADADAEEEAAAEADQKKKDDAASTSAAAALRKRNMAQVDKLIGAGLQNEKLLKEAEDLNDKLRQLEKDNEALRHRLEDYNTLFGDTAKKNA